MMMNPLHVEEEDTSRASTVGLEAVYPRSNNTAAALAVRCVNRPCSILLRDSIPGLTMDVHKNKWYCQRRSVSATLFFTFAFIVTVSMATLGGRIGLTSSVETSNDLFVEVYGSDTGDGSQARPFATITRASRAALPGAIVRVGPGSYNLSSIIYTSASGLQHAPIIYLSVVEWGTRLHASHSGEALWLNRGSFVEIRGFDLSGGLVRTGLWTEGRDVTLSGNFIHDIGDKVASCGQTSAAGIYAPLGTRGTASSLSGRNNVFSQNVIAHIGGGNCETNASVLADGIFTEAAGDTIISNNVIVSIKGSGITVKTASSFPRISVIFNLLANTTASGLSFLVPTSAKPVGFIANNIIVFNSAYALYSSQPFDGATFSTVTNVVHGNSLGCSVSFNCTTQILRAPGLSTSPLPFSANGLSRQLLGFVPKCSPLSPCIGSGSALPASLSPASLVDFFNQPRTSSPTDIGPFVPPTCGP